jgi:hypothetical protein
MSEAPDDDLPLDDWHNYVYMLLSAECDHCGVVADLAWADDLPEGDPGARAFTVRSVEYLKREGWRMVDGGPCCPACSERLFPTT